MIIIIVLSVISFLTLIVALIYYIRLRIKKSKLNKVDSKTEIVKPDNYDLVSEEKNMNSKIGNEMQSKNEVFTSSNMLSNNMVSNIKNDQPNQQYGTTNTMEKSSIEKSTRGNNSISSSFKPNSFRNEKEGPFDNENAAQDSKFINQKDGELAENVVLAEEEIKVGTDDGIKNKVSNNVKDGKDESLGKMDNSPDLSK